MSKINHTLKPVLVPEGDNTAKLDRDYFLSWRKIQIRIVRGFIFNSASIPMFAWFTIGQPWDPQFWGPALVHDFLYAKQRDNRGPVTRKQADDIFRELLLMNGISKFKAWRMYTAVRIGGGSHWKS